MFVYRQLLQQHHYNHTHRDDIPYTIISLGQVVIADSDVSRQLLALVVPQICSKWCATVIVGRQFTMGQEIPVFISTRRSAKTRSYPP